MIAAESERQFYLGAAGIRMWYAREPLPGAAPSPEFDFSDAEVGPEPVQGYAQQQPGPMPSGAGSRPTPERRLGGSNGAREAGRDGEGAARVANLQALMESPAGDKRPSTPDVAAQSAKAPVAETTEPAAPVAPATEPVPVLNLNVWVGERVALVAGLSSDASLRLQQTLATNILRSLGEASAQSHGNLRWPVFNNLRAPGNSLTDLRAVMAHVLAGAEGRKVIALGVAPAEESGAGGLQHIAGIEPAIAYPHTLAELAVSPALKRGLWQAIKPLAGS